MAVVDDEEVVVSLFSFDLLFVAFVAFDSSSFCGDSGADVVVVVVEVGVVALVVVAFCVASLVPSSFCLFGTGLFSAVAVAVASLNLLHSFRCPPSFQCCNWHSRPQYCTV